MKTIKIKEEFQIPGTDIILEAGDRIQVMKEAVQLEGNTFLSVDGLYEIFFDDFNGGAQLINSKTQRVVTEFELTRPI